MDIRSNINRIHSMLTEKFEKVDVSEKSSRKFGNYFQIRVIESKEVDIIIPFINIDNKTTVEWFYRSNPMNENSDLITRTSSVEDVTSCVLDIIKNNRFSKDYLTK